MRKPFSEVIRVQENQKEVDLFQSEKTDFSRLSDADNQTDFPNVGKRRTNRLMSRKLTFSVMTWLSTAKQGQVFLVHTGATRKVLLLENPKTHLCIRPILP